MDLLSVRDLSKKVNGTEVLRGVSFQLGYQKKLALAGETGSGKTTLMKIIAGLVQADTGEVYFEQTRVKGPEEQLIPGHPSIAFLSQFFELHHNYRVEELLQYAEQVGAEVAEKIYSLCHISHLVKRRTDQLSGGERQRIALARLLVSAPRLLLLDEPFSNLDMHHKRILKAVIRDISREMKMSCMLVSHDPLDLLSWADEILLIKDGVIVQQGPPQEVYSRPENEYVAGLLGPYSIIPEAIAIRLSVSGNHSSGDAQILRPEQLCLSRNNTSGIPGRVLKISFLGSHSDAEVLIDGIVVQVRVQGIEVMEGDEVFVEGRGKLMADGC
jgi:ABC-type sulfate/molybdate transport systems ATPase subunit